MAHHSREKVTPKNPGIDYFSNPTLKHNMEFWPIAECKEEMNKKGGKARRDYALAGSREQLIEN